MTSKTSTGVELTPAAGIKNVFTKDWKGAFFKDPMKKIASISFIRNLIEYTRGETNPEFVKLTSLLHWKVDSQSITVADLDAIYNGLFSAKGSSPDGNKPVVDLIAEEAAKCLLVPEGINFANKVVLAIATRLAAERFMTKKIADAAFSAGIEANQTAVLLKRFQTQFSGDTASIGVLQRVALMTPENIHLNSFMYEPILDMSDQHLRKLFQEVQALA
jgi:hypothetical protein